MWYLLPLLLPVGLIAFSIVALSLLLLDLYKSELVWPLGLLAAVLSAVATYRLYPQRTFAKADAVWAGIILVSALLWGGFNMLFASQHVYVDRDPGVYGQAAVWLREHDSIKIPKAGIFGEEKYATESSAGFGNSLREKTEIYAQGTHTVPALIGLVSRSSSIGSVYKIAPLLACFAFMAFFVFARLFAGSKWAYISTLALAVSLPALYFSRDIYTEMLALTFIFTGACLTYLAMKREQSALGSWLLAGLSLGAASMVRIDSIVPIAGIFGAVFVYLMLLPKRVSRGRLLLHFSLFTIVFLLVAGLGLLDLYFLASGYIKSLYPELWMELMAFGSIFIMGIVATVIAWKTKLLGIIDKHTMRWRAKAGAILALGVCLFLAIRPLWMVDRKESRHEVVRGLVEQIQASEGSALDGYRTYAEATVNWIAWYIGPVLTVLAVMGLIIAVMRLLSTRDMKWLIAVAMIGGTSLIYLAKPSITPDQIWASRRLLPVILPGVALFGAVGFFWLEQRKKLPLNMNSKVLAGVLATLAVIGPLIISSPFLLKREYDSQLAQVKQLCASLPDKAALLWVAGGKDTAVQTSRSICQVPAVGVRFARINKQQFTGIAKKVIDNGYTPIVATLTCEYVPHLGVDSSTTRVISSAAYFKYNSTVSRPPHGGHMLTSTVSLGVVNANGSVTPLPGVSPEPLVQICANVR